MGKYTNEYVIKLHYTTVNLSYNITYCYILAASRFVLHVLQHNILLYLQYYIIIYPYGFADRCSCVCPHCTAEILHSYILCITDSYRSIKGLPVTRYYVNCIGIQYVPMCILK